MEKTLGEKRVRTDFNVSSSSDIDKVKRLSAELIDSVDKILPNPKDAEQARLKALALTSYEEAAMWAVKALTI